MTTATATTTATAALATTAAANQLTASLGKSSLAALVAARTRKSMMLCDASGSMNATIGRSPKSRMLAMGEVVTALRSTNSFPLAAFSGRGVNMVDGVPTRGTGGTPMNDAIDFAKRSGANHIVLVTDGEPNFADATLDAASAFGGVIDVFFIGDATDHGVSFAQKLARLTGGTCNLTDLGEGAIKQLATSIRGLLGEGTAL